MTADTSDHHEQQQEQQMNQSEPQRGVSLLTCVICGRVGVTDFEPVEVTHPPGDTTSGDPPAAAGTLAGNGVRVRCRSRRACRHRATRTTVASTSSTTIPPPGTPGGVSVAMVAGLAREVEQLRRDVDQVPVLGDQVADLAALVGDLATQVTTQSARPATPGVRSWLSIGHTPGPESVDTVTGEITDDTGGGPQVTPEETRVVLRELADWVEQVYLRYPDATTLPECWPWHPDAVEELTWLHAAWREAYRATTTASRAADWHDRYRPGVVRRLGKIATCSLDTHDQVTTRGATAGGGPVVLREALDAVASWWATNPHDPAPAPHSNRVDLDGRPGVDEATVPVGSRGYSWAGETR